MNYVIRTKEDLADFVNVVLDIQEPKIIEINEFKNNRSLAQNSLYWLWLSILRDHINSVTGKIFDAEDLHQKMMRMFLSPKVAEFKDETIKTWSTKKLNSKEFSEYLNKLDMYSADRLNLVLPHPINEYDLAMGRVSE